MRIRTLIGLVALCLSFGAQLASAQDKDTGRALNARCLAGLPNIKHNAHGLLSIQDAALQFDAGKHRAAIPLSTIGDIFTGSETTEVGGLLADAAKGAAVAAPYDSGAALTLFLRQKVDVLTVTYRDSNGGLHAAIFALPKGRAQQLRADLTSKGSQPPSAVDSRANATTAPKNSVVDPKATPAAAQPADQSKPAILIDPVLDGGVPIPVAFRMATYEDLVERVGRSGLFSEVYRSGDRAAEHNTNLLTLRTAVQEFKEGSQTVREIVVILGETKVALAIRLTRPDGTDVVNQKVAGKVLFFGENLGVTHDVAKRVVKVLRKNSQAFRGSPAT
ncbi:MAG: hypothetical protein WAK91_13255 [Candidatus Acidiferrales bacterium]|jgi:hypothetical protein